MLCFAHELQRIQALDDQTRGDVPTRKRVAPKGVSERTPVGPADARKRVEDGTYRGHQETTWIERAMSMDDFDFPVTLTPQPEGGFVVTFPDVPEAITQGEDEDESLLYAVDALETALSFYVDQRAHLPLPSAPKPGQITVRPSALECAKLGVYRAMTEQGVRKAELARRLGWHLPQVDRLFDLRHASRLDQIESAARALGRHIEIRVT